MVSKQTMNIVIEILIVGLGAILTIGLLLSSPNGNNQVPVNTAPASNVNVNQDAEWAKNASDTIPILVNDIINMSGAATDDLYTTSLEFENYKTRIYLFK